MSWYGHTFCLTAVLCRESTSTKAINAELLQCLLFACISFWTNNKVIGEIRQLNAHDVILVTWYSVWSCYNMVSYLQSAHNRPPITHPQKRVTYEGVLWHLDIIHVVTLELLGYM